MAEEIDYAPKKAGNYVEALDGIRGIGCFAVMWTHFHFTSFNVPFTFSLIALHSFFIMSAYLITRNLLKERNRWTGFKPFVQVFYVKRTARIFPIYFIYLFSVIIIFSFTKIVFNNSMNVIPELKRYGWMLFTFLYNLKMQICIWKGYDDYFGCFLFPHLWSVSLEEQFYLMVIFMLWICSKNSLRVISILFIIAIPLIRIYGYYSIGEKTSDDFLRALAIIQSPYYQFDSFFYGIAMAVFDVKKSKKMIWMFWIALAVLLGHAAVNAYICSTEEQVTIFKVLREDKFFYRNYGIYFLDIFLNLFCCAWIYCVIHYPEKFSLFSRKLLVKFGELSYAMYIFQFLVLGVGVILTAVLMRYARFPAFPAEFIGFACYVVLNYYLALWLNRKVESPVAAYKDRVLERIRAKGSK